MARTDLSTRLLSAGLLAPLLLLLLFSVRWRLLPLLIVLIGVVWAFGIAGYLGLSLTIVTIAGLPVMLGLQGADYTEVIEGLNPGDTVVLIAQAATQAGPQAGPQG